MGWGEEPLLRVGRDVGRVGFDHVSVLEVSERACQGVTAWARLLVIDTVTVPVDVVGQVLVFVYNSLRGLKVDERIR